MAASGDMRPLSEHLAAGPLDPAGLRALAAALLDTLAEEHALERVTGSLSADRILWDGAETLVLVERRETLPAAPREVKGLAPRDLPPEAWRDPAKACTAAAEVYQAGLLLYRAAAGEHPFADLPVELLERIVAKGPPPISALRDDLDRLWDGLLANCLHAAADERYPDAFDLRRAFAPLLGRNGGRPPRAGGRTAAGPRRLLPVLAGPLGYALAAAALLLFLLAVELPWHGRSQDDKVQRDRGTAVLRYLASGDRSLLPRDPDPKHFGDRGDPYYGPLAVTLAQALGPVLAPVAGAAGREPYAGFHAGIALFGALSFFALCCLGRVFFGTRAAGWLAGLAWLTFPRIWPLLTVNPSDLPAAAFGALALAAALGWRVRPSLVRGLAAALLLAAVAAVRPADAGVLAAAVAAGTLLSLHRPPRIRALWFAAAPILCWFFWVLAWPSFWTEPIAGPLRVLRGLLTERGQYVHQVTLWFGEPATGPRAYPFVMLWLSTPLPVLLLLALGITSLPRTRPGARAMLVLWLAFALGKHLGGIANHGGVRHFLAAYVPLALVTAAGAQRLVRGLRAARLRAPLAAAILAALAAYARSGHPFEGSYYNAFTGGVRGAAGRFDLDQDGSSALVLLRSLRPRLEARDALFVFGTGDLARQLTLPEGLLVVELTPGMAGILERLAQDPPPPGDPLVGRRLLLIAVQDRYYGLFEPLVARGALRELLRVGPAGLPLGLCFEIPDRGGLRALAPLLRGGR